jgi:hypothetical protein
MTFVRTLVLGSSKIALPQAVSAESEQMTRAIVLYHPGDNRVQSAGLRERALFERRFGNSLAEC